jgi:hypothetical protein
MKNNDQPPRYEMLLLTFWADRSQNTATGEGWRFRVEEVDTRQKHGFTTLEEVVAFIQSKMARPQSGQPKRND